MYADKFDAEDCYQLDLEAQDRREADNDDEQSRKRNLSESLYAERWGD
jgi:hypothetical protein